MTGWISRARLLLAVLPCSLGAEVPEGFRPIFNSQNLAGWHMSLTSHHGDTKEWRVFEGALVGKQDREGNGGILLTDEQFGDFEVYLEIKPDFGCDGGVFLRSTGSGQAYQVMLDYLAGGNLGGVYGEQLESLGDQRSDGWEKVWRKDDWNSLRARIQGEAPHIEVWLNGSKITDFRDSKNRLPQGATEGAIAVQVHGGNRCSPGLEHRFRNIAVREL
ncbi:MAG: DUF1080 domain-containing protein [Bryobacterales bacterium]|nr:DUF1080 domain-containing protein [Bryobacterales bacterium]MDE0264290.1 DUF1080 domain-containing protein [Bryobacterales bacterium]